MEQPTGASTKIDELHNIERQQKRAAEDAHGSVVPLNKTQPGTPTCQEQDYQLGNGETFSLKKKKSILFTLHGMKDNRQGANSCRHKCSELKLLGGECEIRQRAQICVCVCLCVFFSAQWLSFPFIKFNFSFIYFWERLGCSVWVRAHVSVCTLVGLKLINLARFCLWIILLSVDTMTNPWVHCCVSVPPSHIAPPPPTPQSKAHIKHFEIKGKRSENKHAQKQVRGSITSHLMSQGLNLWLVRGTREFDSGCCMSGS